MIKEELKDIILMVSGGEISNRYFGKPSSWIYDKINNDSFTNEEEEILRRALADLSMKMKEASHK